MEKAFYSAIVFNIFIGLALYRLYDCYNFIKHKSEQPPAYVKWIIFLHIILFILFFDYFLDTIAHYSGYNASVLPIGHFWKFSAILVLNGTLSKSSFFDVIDAKSTAKKAKKNEYFSSKDADSNK